jgi:hypothetical protein
MLVIYALVQSYDKIKYLLKLRFFRKFKLIKFKFMKKSYDKLVELIKKNCKEYGVKLDIRPTSYVKIDSSRCSGFFDPEEENLRIVVAGKAENFEATLLHEYCHLTQYIDNDKLWRKSNKSLTILFEWLEGKDYSKRKIKRHAAVCRELELDNEKRAAKMARKYDVGLSVKEYTKRANAYVLFYNWLPVTRKWSSSENSPYRNENLIKAMSGKFDMNYEKLDPKIKKIFKEEKI